MKHRNLFFALIITIFLIIYGCAGRDFVRPSSDAFKLGQTTYSQIKQQFGEPQVSCHETFINKKFIKTIRYAYSTSPLLGETLEKGVVPVRGMMYSFYNDVLVGQAFISSFKSDNTNFDHTKIDRIIKGKTTRSEVIQLLGMPAASFIHPVVEDASGEAIVYIYKPVSVSFLSGLKTFKKIWILVLDGRGVVSDIDFDYSTIEGEEWQAKQEDIIKMMENWKSLQSGMPVRDIEYFIGPIHGKTGDENYSTMAGIRDILEGSTRCKNRIRVKYNGLLCTDYVFGDSYILVFSPDKKLALWCWRNPPDEPECTSTYILNGKLWSRATIRLNKAFLANYIFCAGTCDGVR